MICLYFWFLYILFQFISVAQSWPTLWDTMDCSTSGFQHQLLELLRLMSIQSVMPPNYLMLCYPLLLLPPIFPSIRVYSNESVLHLGWPKYWSFIFRISPSNKYSVRMSFRIDWFDVLSVQRTLKSILQYQVQKHQFFSAQFSL